MKRPQQVRRLPLALAIIACLLILLCGLLSLDVLDSRSGDPQLQPAANSRELEIELAHEIHFGYPLTGLRIDAASTSGRVDPVVAIRSIGPHERKHSNRAITGPLFGTRKWFIELIRSWNPFASRDHHREPAERKPKIRIRDMEPDTYSTTPLVNKYDHLLASIGPSPTNNAATRSLPDLTDPFTLLTLGKISHNSYYSGPQERDWRPSPGTPWHFNSTYGWESNGLRGHLYTSPDKSIVIMGIKGTSPAWLGIGGPTGVNDRFQDNLLFSCCCARIDILWRHVCDCYRGRNHTTDTQMCSRDCLESASRAEDTYYNAARVVYAQARLLYPDSEFWFVGHSLGGALASVMAMTTGSVAIAYESPGDRLYAGRLGFSSLETVSQLPIFHIGNSADPIYMGECRGPLSACAAVGYAMESKCHAGTTCMYVLPGEKLDIRYHQTSTLIAKILEPADRLPQCRQTGGDGCTDCSWWQIS